MKLKQLAVALLCGTMLVAPAFAQSTTTPAGIGTSPNGLSSTITSRGGPSTTGVVAGARGSVPSPGSPVETITSGQTATGVRPGAAAMPAMSMTNINTASAVDLDKLPQIGKARAAKIIKMRPYASTDELVSKKVLPMSVYNKIKTQISAS